MSDKKTITIPEEQLIQLLNQNDEYKKEVEDLLKVAKGICEVLGLTDEAGNVKPEFLDGTESPMPSVLKAIMGTVASMTAARFGGKKAEAEIGKKFDFIKYLVPIINKYQKQ